MEIKADIIVIGAGIAGASLAAECAGHAEVVLLEREEHAGMHATGRSAAFFAPSYGNEVVRVLSAASEDHFRNPPAEYFNEGLLRPRDNVFIATAGQDPQLAEMGAAIPTLEALSNKDLLASVPLMRQEYLSAALIDRTGGDLDVDAILQGYLRKFRSLGGRLHTGESVQSLRFSAGLWHVYTNKERFVAPVIVNAGGAWADVVAEQAGLSGLGISPLRRTALLVDLPPGIDAGMWPLVVDVDEAFYFKPDAGLLLISPADETPDEPGDVHAHEWDIAVAVDRVSKVLDLNVRRINHSWAGLRSFYPDRTFVVGEDPRASGFFWLAGQGGYGVQSSPAIARLAAHQLTGCSLAAEDEPLLDLSDSISAARFIDAS